MGNSPLASLRLRNGDQFYQVQLGESAALYFRRIEVKRQGIGKITEAWLMSYQLDISTCNFALTKTKGNSKSHPHHDDMLDIKILDDAHGISRDCFSVTVQRAEAGLLHPTFSTGLNMNPRSAAAASSFPMSTGFTIVSNHTTITTDAWGGITQTSFDIYGRGTRRGLTVREWKKKSEDEKPYMGTVAHYYANTENGKDVGLSVVIKRIRVSQDGHLDFDVDGPEEHPVHALFYMFDEVLRTGTWKPTYCPHCANYIIQKHRMSWPSDGEESDRDNVLAALLRRRKKNAGGIIANDGVFKGNNNGNLLVDKLIIVHEVDPVSTKYGENSTNGLSNKILDWWAYVTSFI